MDPHRYCRPKVTPLRQGQKVRQLAVVVERMRQGREAYERAQAMRDGLIEDLLAAGLEPSEIVGATGVSTALVARAAKA